uniref:Uncharacterized protein n=1 Tax=Octopus bimaculoides TaxID=37653 RepID=A0A0L8HAK5_OCTBM
MVESEKVVTIVVVARTAVITMVVVATAARTAVVTARIEVRTVVVATAKIVVTTVEVVTTTSSSYRSGSKGDGSSGDRHRPSLTLSLYFFILSLAYISYYIFQLPFSITSLPRLYIFTSRSLFPPLSTYISLPLYVAISVSQYPHISFPFYLYISLSLALSLSLTQSPHIFLSLSLAPHIFLYLHIFLSHTLSIFMSLSPRHQWPPYSDDCCIAHGLIIKANSPIDEVFIRALAAMVVVEEEKMKNKTPTEREQQHEMVENW